MNQILAILKKDARHLWPEILVSLAVLTALVFYYPTHWQTIVPGYEAHTTSPMRPFLSTGRGRDFLAGCLVVLVPLSWLVLIARVVHIERLTGDTQFWLTRPYEWPKFLVAKALFLLTFICLPFFIMQSILLDEAGFHPLSYLPGLSFCLVTAFATIVLPLFAFSSITTGFGRLLLILVGFIIYIITAASVQSALPFEFRNSVKGPFNSFYPLCFLCACAAIVLVQYCRRRTRFAWVLMIATCLFITLLSYIDPDRWLVNHQYPEVTAGILGPLRLEYAASPTRQANTVPAEEGILQISVPVEFQGLPTDSAVDPTAFMATLQAADGAKWVSPWQSTYSGHLQDGASNLALRFKIRRATYDRFKTSPVTLLLTVAFTLVQARSTSQVALQPFDFSVPGFGICSPGIDFDFADVGKVTSIVCRSAMREPPLTYVTAHWSEGDCSTGQSNADSVLGNAWTGSTDTAPAEFQIAPVSEVPLELSNSIAEFRRNSPPRRRHLCPGSLLLFTRYVETKRAQTSLAIQNFQLPSMSTFQGLVEERN